MENEIQVLHGNAHYQVSTYMQNLVFSSVCFIVIIVPQMIFWRFYKLEKRLPVGVLEKGVFFISVSFLLADVDTFMDFLVLDEHLKTTGHLFLGAGL